MISKIVGGIFDMFDCCYSIVVHSCSVQSCQCSRRCGVIILSVAVLCTVQSIVVMIMLCVAVFYAVIVTVRRLLIWRGIL